MVLDTLAVVFTTATATTKTVMLTLCRRMSIALLRFDVLVVGGSTVGNGGEREGHSTLEAEPPRTLGQDNHYFCCCWSTTMSTTASTFSPRVIKRWWTVVLAEALAATVRRRR